MKRVEMVGRRFGNCVVVSDITSTVCECICDCGKTFTTRGQSLRAGVTKSCGCLKRASKGPSKNFKDLTGKVFSRLTVLGRSTEKTKRRSCTWVCLCDCGNVITTSSEKLNTGTKKSCGCLQKEYCYLPKPNTRTVVAGLVFSALTVIEHLTKDGKSLGVSLCKCVCGKEVVVHNSALQTGNTRSCGCLKESHRQQTCVKNFGTDHHMKSKDILDKARETYSSTMHKSGFRSAPELELDLWINSIGLETTHFSSGARELDVYIPSLSIGVEYNGDFNHSEARKRTKARSCHLDKLTYYSAKGIKVIQIWGHQWATRKEQVKNFLKSALGKNTIKIGARKCQFKEISKQEAWEFIDARHIQPPNKRTTYALGAYYQEKLVAVTTFSLHHRGTGEVVLDRFVCEHDTTVSGALAKMTQIASSHFKCDIITWAHRTLSEGKGYLASGWLQEDILPPDYFYVKSGNKIVSKQSRKKSAVGTPEGITEHEHALKDGLHRVWDCGKIRFRYIYKEPPNA